MPTTADYLAALVATRDSLAKNIAENGGTVTGEKLNTLAEDVNSIVWGDRHYLTGSGTVNKDGDRYPSVFTVTTAFAPCRFVVNFSSVLAGAFSDNSNYFMIGRLTLTDIAENDGRPQQHRVTLQTGTGTVQTVTLTTTVTRTADGHYDLTVTLPTTPAQYVFRGAFDWLCTDTAFEGDDE